MFLCPDKIIRISHELYYIDAYCLISEFRALL